MYMNTHVSGNVNSCDASGHSPIVYCFLFIYQNSLSGMNMLLTHEHLDNTDRKNMLALIGQFLSCRLTLHAHLFIYLFFLVISHIVYSH